MLEASATPYVQNITSIQCRLRVPHVAPQGVTTGNSSPTTRNPFPLILDLFLRRRGPHQEFARHPTQWSA